MKSQDSSKMSVEQVASSSKIHQKHESVEYHAHNDEEWENKGHYLAQKKGDYAVPQHCMNCSGNQFSEVPEGWRCKECLNIIMGSDFYQGRNSAKVDSLAKKPLFTESKYDELAEVWQNTLQEHREKITSLEAELEHANSLNKDAFYGGNMRDEIKSLKTAVTRLKNERINMINISKRIDEKNEKLNRENMRLNIENDKILDKVENIVMNMHGKLVFGVGSFICSDELLKQIQNLRAAKEGKI